MKNPPLILASTSPRRIEMLRAMRLPFTVALSGIDEPHYQAGSASDFARRLAELKASAVAQTVQDGLVIGADTVVVRDDQVLEKPRDEREAAHMLRALSGRWHQVLTGVCLIKVRSRQRRTGCEMTKVKFASMQPDEVAWYVSTGEPMDKAGGYAIQGYGALFVERIEGDFLNVVGLPLRLVYDLARELEVDLKSYVSSNEGD